MFTRNFEGFEPIGEFSGTQVFATDNFEKLPEATRQRVEPQLIEAAARGFIRPINNEFSLDVANHLRGGRLYMITQEGRAEGFALMTQPKPNVVYISGVVKNPATPSRVIEKVVGYHLDQTGVDTVTVRTQNDRVVELMTKVCEFVVPVHKQPGMEELDILGQIGLLNQPDIRARELIVKGYYGGSMIGSSERRRSLNPLVRSVTDGLDYFAGDALLVVGYRGQKVVYEKSAFQRAAEGYFFPSPSACRF